MANHVPTNPANRFHTTRTGCLRRTAMGWLMVCAALAAGAGCRNRGSQELLERELRLQEDKIYQLRDQLEVSRAELEACQRLLSGDHHEGSSRSSSPKVRSDVDLDLPPGIDSPAAPPFTPPRIEPPPGVGPSSNPSGNPSGNPASFHPSSDGGPKVEAPPLPTFGGPAFSEVGPEDGSQTQLASGVRDLTASKRVAFVTLNKPRTGGQTVDPETGGELLHVVLEPRNASGQAAATAGDVTVVVLDPTQRGAQARVARWDFTAAQVEAYFQSTGGADGLHLELEWPAERPRTHRMALYIRFITAEGKELKLEHPLEPIETSPTTPASWIVAPESLPHSTSPPFTPPPDFSPRPLTAPAVVGRPTWTPFR